MVYANRSPPRTHIRNHASSCIRNHKPTFCSCQFPNSAYWCNHIADCYWTCDAYNTLNRDQITINWLQSVWWLQITFVVMQHREQCWQPIRNFCANKFCWLPFYLLRCVWCFYHKILITFSIVFFFFAYCSAFRLLSKHLIVCITCANEHINLFMFHITYMWNKCARLFWHRTNRRA